MKIKKQDLLEALEIVKPGLANQEIIEQSTSFAFMGDRVVTYNDAISISHPINGLELSGAVRAEELYGFLQKSKSEVVQIAFSDNKLKMKCGSAIAELVFQAEVILPVLEIENTGIENEIENAEDFIDSLDFIKDTCSKDMTRPVLACVHLTEWGMEASDGYQIMRVYSEGFPFSNLLIPARAIPEIKKINPTRVELSESWIHFANEQNSILSCRIISDKFPSTEDFFEVDGVNILFPDNMIEIIDRAMVFAKKDHFMDEELDIKMKNKILLVQSGNDYGKFKEKTKTKYKGKPVSFSISPYLLKNILNKGGESILGEDKIKFQKEGWEYIATLKAE